MVFEAATFHNMTTVESILNSSLLGTIEDFSTTVPLLESASPPKRNMIFPWYPAIILWDYMFMFLSFPGNALTVVAYIKFDSLKTPTNLLICSQSAADLCMFCIGHLFVWYNYSKWGLQFASTNKYACLVMLSSIVFSMLTSVINLLAISAERLLSIAFPYRYYQWVTDVTTRRAVIIIWVGIIIHVCLPLVGWNTWRPGGKCMTMHVYTKIYSMYLFLLPCFCVLIITAIFNIIICVIAVKKQRVAPALHPPTTVAEEGAETTNNQQTSEPKQQFKVTKMLLMVVGVFYLSWLPYLVLTIMFIYPPQSWRTQGFPEGVFVMHEVSKGFVMLNAAANPVIYAWKNAQFRLGFKRLLRMKIVPNDDTQISVSVTQNSSKK